MLTRQKGYNFRRGRERSGLIDPYGEKFGRIKFAVKRLDPLKYVKKWVHTHWFDAPRTFTLLSVISVCRIV